MKTTTLLTHKLSITLFLFSCTFLNISASESNQNDDFIRLLQEYDHLRTQVRNNRGVELVSSPSPEHISIAEEFFSVRPQYTTEELHQFADQAHFTYCTILAWANSGYRGENPNIAYTLASHNHQLARIQGRFYYEAALFVNSNSRHNQGGLESFGQRSNQHINRLRTLTQ